MKSAKIPATHLIRFILCLTMSLGSRSTFAQTDFWKPTNGPNAGLVKAFDINTSGHIFTGTEGGGVFRSQDNGASWVARNAGLSNLVVEAFAINASGHVFAGTDGGGLFRSINNGDNWTERNSGLTNDVILSIAINSSGHVFVGTDGGGVFRSTNNGDSWTARNSGLTNRNVLSLAINGSGHVFAGTEGGGIFRSTNNGDSWTARNNGLANLIVESISINASGHIFATTDGGGVFRSIDNGDNWNAINNGLTNLTVVSFAINANGDLFAGTFGGGVFCSKDNGGRWDPVNSGLSSLVITALAVNNTDGHAFAGTSTGVVFRSAASTVAPPAPLAPTLVLPANGETNQPTTLSLSWNASASAETYRLQVSTSADFAAPVVDDSTLTSISRQVGPLANKTTYFWRVNAKNAGGASPFSEVRSFTTIVAPPPAPMLAAPANGAVNQPTTLTLSWNPAIDAESYRLQVSTSADFVSPVVDDSTVTATSRQVGPLANNVTYFWRVRAKNIAATSAYSEVRSFTTIVAAPSTPTLVAPENGAVHQPVTLTLSWSAATDAQTYRLQVSTDENFTSTVVDDSTLTGTSQQVGPFGNKAKHFWRVQAKNIAGTSEYSEVWSFTTIVARPSTPTLAVPGNGAVNQPVTLTLSWNAVTDAVTYRLQVSTVSDFVTSVVDDSTITATSQQVGPLAGNTTYFWRVSAKNLAGTSAFSDARTFTTMLIILPPSIPTLASPGDGTASQPTTLTLTWNAVTNAEAYHLQVAPASDFATTVVDDSTITAVSRLIGPLSSGTTYYWRVSAKNSVGSSAYSDIWSFTTIQLPDTVFLLSPSHDEVVEVDSVQFTWLQSAPAITRYWFEFSKDSSMTNAMIDSTLTAADTVKVVYQLSNLQEYWWRVRAGNAAGWGPFGEQRHFRVDIKTSVVDVAKGTVGFRLHQNYPNPFNPSTTIEYDLSKPALVILKVYDLLGNEVRTLVHDQQPAGQYRIQFDGKNLPAGIYFYRIHAGEFLQTKKLMLVK